MSNCEPVFRSLAVIEENIRKKLTVDSLADSIYLSRYHYQRIFREIMGESVMGYVSRRRLALAAADLAETNESILSIALKYGYDSHEGFSRSFRAHMGVSPREYRKYHLSNYITKTRKETVMTDSKTTDEIIRNMNHLIAQIGETAEYTRKNSAASPDGAKIYSGFWDVIAASAEAIAEELGKVLERITSLRQRPDEISARFLIMRSMETAGLKTDILTFQIKLMLARANPEHRTAFEPITARYVELAQNARTKLCKTAEFFQELTALIFQDMRKDAEQKLRAAAEAGRLAADKLSESSALPCGYLGDEINEIAEELSSLALEDVSVPVLEDDLLRLELVASAADLDLLRMPDHRQLFDGIPAFRERLEEVLLFFGELSSDVVRELAGRDGSAGQERTADTENDNLVFQSRILLFYLKGEIRKLGPLLSQEQRSAFDNICDKMSTVTRPARRREEDNSPEKGVEILREVHGMLLGQAEKLGACDAPVRFIAEEIRKIV